MEGETTNDEETLGSGDEDEDEGPWMEPPHGGGHLPGVVRRRLVPTVSFPMKGAVALDGRGSVCEGYGGRRNVHVAREHICALGVGRLMQKARVRPVVLGPLIFGMICSTL